MSYDLAVFAAEGAPRDRDGFLAWYESLAETIPEETLAARHTKLAGLYTELRESYPAMNGPFAVDDPDDPHVTDYEVGPALIYCCFAWSQAAPAYDTLRGLAGKHGVGFFDVSGSTSAVWLPGPDGTLTLAHEDRPGPERRGCLGAAVALLAATAATLLARPG